MISKLCDTDILSVQRVMRTFHLKLLRKLEKLLQQGSMAKWYNNGTTLAFSKNCKIRKLLILLVAGRRFELPTSGL